MDYEYKLQHKDLETGDIISMGFNTIHRDHVIDIIFKFLAASGFGFQKYIVDEVNDLIENSIETEHRMYESWDDEEVDSNPK